MSAVSFLAGLGAGTVRSERVEREMAMREQDEARRQALFDATMQDRARALADRTALVEAGQPVAVESGEVYQPANDDDGNPMPANPTAGTYKVGAQRFASEGVAQEVAAKEPGKRIQAALMAQGNPVAANQVRASTNQAEAAEAHLKQFTENALKEGTMDFLGKAMAGATPEELKTAFNKNGKVKLKDVTVTPFEFDHPALGKQKSAKIQGTLEDGTVVDIPDAFQASFALFGAAKRFELLQGWDRDKANKEDRAADNARADKQLAMMERQRAESADLQRRQLEMQAEQYKLTRQQAGIGAGITWDKEADTFLKDRFTTKQDGAVTVDAPGLQFAKTIALAQASRNGGDTTRAGAYAMEINDRLVAQANGDPAVLHKLRSDLLASMTPKAPAAPSNPADGISKPVFGAGYGAPAPAAPAAPATIAQQGVGAAPQVPPQHAAALQPLSDQVAQASAALAAAAKSGDPQAIAMYGQKVEQARAARLQEAVRRLGQAGAQAYIASLPQ